MASTGSEGRINGLKRGYGWDRTRLDGTEGARTWTVHVILAHNLVKIGVLTDLTSPAAKTSKCCPASSLPAHPACGFFRSK